MVKIETMTVEEIKFSQTTKEVEEYYQELDNLKTNRISKNVVESLIGQSLLKIMDEIDYQETMSRSNIFFPGDLMVLYPNIKELHSKSFQTCDFSGALIYPKSLYVNYRPLIENITTNETYVLKRTLKVEPAFTSRLPNTITELENLEINIQLETSDDEINFSHLNQRVGGQLVLQKLRRNKYENRNR